MGIITTNYTIDQLRRRHDDAALAEFEREAREKADQCTPQLVLERRQHCHLAERAIEKLSADEREFVLACFRDERSPSELAEELGVATSTIYSRKFKLRHKLFRIMCRLHLPRRARRERLSKAEEEVRLATLA